MRYRLTFIVGLAVGYVLGTRAGREQYEKLRESAQQFRENPSVRNTAESAAQNGRQMAGKAFDSVNERVGHRLPHTMEEKVHSLSDRRSPQTDEWGTTKTASGTGTAGAPGPTAPSGPAGPSGPGPTGGGTGPTGTVGNP